MLGAHFIIHHSLGASCSIQDAWDWSQSDTNLKNSDHLAGNDSAPPFQKRHASLQHQAIANLS